MDLKSTQYIEKTGSVAKAFLFLFLLFLSSIYNLFKFASLENEEVKVSDMVLSGDVEYIEQDDLSANCKFLIDRTTHWLG
ncbi:hypothetical protein AAH011_03165 [Parabacteroides distasonis]|jgi:hypothetical protein|uniref:Uncharacterized protein n=1 Tax=Parabacteroides distasonis TaxID=823 RepID=A0AB35J358_PARDI|nr:hypothetical protein [Parabacteroides distasonis]MDB9003604.1 hypothetical protein [Parabacteroides distasonis]MDB9007500.1 hypothetical protein [Parabacteroides distasonis]MDB9020214.1 hypothetical protein [Parabacteroides distasonis]